MPKQTAEPGVPYEAPCPCGQVLRGWRQPTRQIVSCPQCGRKRFLLPGSPWPGREAAADAPATRLRLGRLLAIIVVGGALAMGLIFLLVKVYLKYQSAGASRTESPADLPARIESAERQLREGNVHLALDDLNAALALRDRHANRLSREDHRRIDQLRRQCALLAQLLDRSLEEIVQQALHHHNDAEWRAKFAHYRGRTVIFDDVLRRDAQGRPVLGSYIVRAGDITARVALEDVLLLKQLELEPPRRWLFGATLADCRREEGGVWVLRFEPDSGVLLTDEAAAAVCCPQPFDEELPGVLKRQEEVLRR